MATRPSASADRPPIAGDGTRFNTGDRSHVRRARPWHPLAYIIRALPEGIRQLSGSLDVPPDATIVDFGCAEVPYRDFFRADADYIAADLPGNPAATVHIDDAGRLPLPDDSADVVLSTQVLEHVANPEVYLEEAWRVLRPGGRMLLTTHGIMVYHPDPVDFWRWTCAGLRESTERAGFRVVRFEGIMGLAATGLQLFQDRLYPTLPRVPAAALALVIQTTIALSERFESAEARRGNALVFGLIAEKPR